MATERLGPTVITPVTWIGEAQRVLHRTQGAKVVQLPRLFPHHANAEGKVPRTCRDHATSNLQSNLTPRDVVLGGSTESQPRTKSTENPVLTIQMAIPRDKPLTTLFSETPNANKPPRLTPRGTTGTQGTPTGQSHTALPRIAPQGSYPSIEEPRKPGDLPSSGTQLSHIEGHTNHTPDT